MNNPNGYQKIASTPHQLIRQVRHRLNGDGLAANWGDFSNQGSIKGSAVLLLLTLHAVDTDAKPEPCLLLNKRSQNVLQPGDLCCPGGGVARFDRWMATLLRQPLSPLYRWPNWTRWQANHPRKAKGLALLLSTGLREAFEEMRLNPLRVSFLGPLPVQQLMMFKRQIYPLAAWVPAHQRLKPNREVARIVRIPLKRLLEPGNYARMRLRFNTGEKTTHRKEDLPCFIHQRRNGQEVLWGATFRIVMDFMKRVYGFDLPDLKDAPVRIKKIDTGYLNGSLMNPSAQNQTELDEDY